MSIDIDKGFKKIEHLRFFRIKNAKLEKKVANGSEKQERESRRKPRGKYKARKSSEEIIEKAKLLLIDGQNQKSIAYEIGRNLSTIAGIIKRSTGLTLRQFEREYASEKSPK